jgi:hypothetical protein
MTDKPMTIGDVRAAIKELPDDMPVYLNLDDYEESMSCLSITKMSLMVYDGNLIEALVLGAS